MSAVESITGHLTHTLSASEPLNAPWVERGGVFWLDYPNLEVREVALAMNAVGARFITITAYERPGQDGLRLEYHWDLAGRLLGFNFALVGNSIESIYDICGAVDWIEREIHEGFNIEFTGHDYEPLLLREGNVCGVNLREEVAK